MKHAKFILIEQLSEKLDVIKDTLGQRLMR